MISIYPIIPALFLQLVLLASYYSQNCAGILGLTPNIEYLLRFRLESIMLQNLLMMLFSISPIFCLLCSFLCFLGMNYADNLYL